MGTICEKNPQYLETMTKVYLAIWLIPSYIFILYGGICISFSITAIDYINHVLIMGILPTGLCLYFNAHIKTDWEYRGLSTNEKLSIGIFKELRYVQYLRRYEEKADRFVRRWNLIRILSLAK